MRSFRHDFEEFARLSSSQSRFQLAWADRSPCLTDRTPQTSFDAHYIYHCAWAARILSGIRPVYHVDLGSSLNFVTQVSAFIPMAFFDIRPPMIRLDGLNVGDANLTALPFPDGALPSVSCMHVIEHIGLGRYGDALDPCGDLKAIAELRRVVAPAGWLLFVVPVGRPRIAFNAHRIYAHHQVIEAFGGWPLEKYALVTDPGPATRLVADASMELSDSQRYGCGCFLFRRPA